MITPEKISIPLMLVISMLGTATIAGGAWANSRTSITALEVRAAKLDDRADRIESRVTNHDIEHEGMKHDLSHLVDAVDRIEHRIGSK